MFTAEEVVRALYLGVLNREPDPAGLATYSVMLRENPALLMEVASGFFRSEEHLARLAGASLIHDHSQNGEFRIFLRHFLEKAARHRLIVDVGANGRERSNSFDLLKLFGWRGLLVEANPVLWPSIKAEFDGLDYALVRCAVACEEGVMPLFLGVNSDVSSLRRDSVAGWGPVNGEVSVTVRRLQAVLEEFAVPKDFDILSLDIEGLDIHVLNDLVSTTDYRPGLVVLEASMDFANKSLEDIPLCDEAKRSYRLIDSTRANMILARS